MGFEGFSGNESILYHLESPCRIAEAGEFEPIEHEEWVPGRPRPPPPGDGRHPAPRAIRSAGAACLMWNATWRSSICRPAEEAEAFYRNGEGDELLFVHGDRASWRRCSARCPTASTTTS